MYDVRCTTLCASGGYYCRSFTRHTPQQPPERYLAQRNGPQHIRSSDVVIHLNLAHLQPAPRTPQQHCRQATIPTLTFYPAIFPDSNTSFDCLSQALFHLPPLPISYSSLPSLTPPSSRPNDEFSQFDAAQPAQQPCHTRQSVRRQPILPPTHPTMHPTPPQPPPPPYSHSLTTPATLHTVPVRSISSCCADGRVCVRLQVVAGQRAQSTVPILFLCPQRSQRRLDMACTTQQGGSRCSGRRSYGPAVSSAATSRGDGHVGDRQ